MKRLLTMVMALGTIAYGQNRVWGDYIAGGTSCNQWNVGVIENGSSLSILFDEFGVNMPAGDFGDGMSARKTCTFRIQVTPPNGFYVAGFTQVYSGGVIKSRRSSAQINIRYNIGSIVGRPLPILFMEGDEIRPEDRDSLFTRTYENNLLVANCGASTVYGLNMSMSATRRSTYEHLMGGLDSVDAELVQKIVLIPEFRLCRR